MPVIAVATADSLVRAAVHRSLADSDFTAMDAGGGLELLRQVFEEPPAAVILDLDLSDIEGYQLLRILRAASDVPIVALMARPDAEATARALDLGADDVAQHSTPAVELLARLRSALRRSTRTTHGNRDNAMVRTGAITIDRVSKEVRKHGELLAVTRTEYRLLDALAGHLGQMAPHRFLLSAVWGDAYTDDTHYLRVYVGYLRAKIEDDPAHPRYLLNEWGMGYRLAQLPIEDAPEMERPGRNPEMKGADIPHGPIPHGPEWPLRPDRER